MALPGLFAIILLAILQFCRPGLAPAHLSALTLGQGAYAVVATLALATLLNAIRFSLPAAAGVRTGMDGLRLVSLVAVAVWIFRPYLDSNFFGGVDARSYGYAMIDALQQARAGVFPVLVGQGEFMFNGAIHPIRTAPYLENLGILLDLLTLRVLTPVAVLHLTVLVTAVQGALMCYVCLTVLAPARRGAAWLVSVLYISAPSAAAALYGQEMYMTFMTVGWLPLVMFGNAWLIRRDDGTGWICLSAGLALTWFSHPPVAAWLTLCSLFLQGLRLLTRDFHLPAWRRAGGGGLLFVGLTVGYFWSVSEISLTREAGAGRVLGGVVLLIGGAGALIRWLATGRWPWLVTTILAGLTLWFVQPIYGRWLLAALAPGVLLGVKGTGWRNRLPEWSMAVLIIGGLLSLGWTLPGGGKPALGWVVRLFPKDIMPVSASGQLLSDVQVGYALWAALLAGLAAALIAPSWESRLFGLAGLLWSALLLPVPGVTRFLLEMVPAMLYGISSDSTWLRYIPAMVGLGTFLGFMAADGWASRWPGRRGILVFIGLLAAGWNLLEMEKFVRCGYRNVNTPETIAAFYRPENAQQFAYIFPHMPVSPYLTNGVVDYHLESRLLQVDNPAVEVKLPAGGPAVRQVTFTTRVDDSSPYWFHLEPTLTLAPGEHQKLTFGFFDRPYEGTLICRGSNGFYREYALPAAGFFEKSFGVASGRPKSVALWNSGTQPQPVELLFLSRELPPNGRPFGDFARVEIQSYDPERLPVRTTSLIPYRAEVRLDAAAAWLETPRAFIPGYRATVNGQPAEVIDSPNNMAMVKLRPGENRVELRYTGTRALWAGMIMTSLTWTGLAVLSVRAWWRKRGVAAIAVPVDGLQPS